MKYPSSMLILFCLLTPICVWGQLNGASLLVGGEITIHRLVSPADASDLEFEFGFGKTKAEPEQSFFIGAKADWTLKDQFGIQTQIDYGRTAYSVFFRDPTENNGMFGPQTRSLFYAPDRVDISVLPSYKIELGSLEVIPKIGITYSFPVNETDYVDKIANRPGQVRAINIQNALNRSFGGSVLKINAGIDLGYGRFLLHLNLRQQISSASDGPVEVEDVPTPISFDNRITAIQFGLGYRFLQF
ncbi:hypothetical protein FUA23_22010 [Neolewinella aurantiaca]|uniref:Outer membrane protein beta-barrel domain-containing protein n=1 Tax=Neolewinella aurantiaca TaxID=2602767 RepID=A0A5C7EZF6_9BACT|nr:MULTISPECIES: hypothetical protein [Neolewinella]TXF81326.1 hypothetical protein FUA23_22010 [Neolewinella aurantiaca]